jgi:hypothetical protein
VNMAALRLEFVAESLTLKSRGLPIVGDQRVDETLTKVNFSRELGLVTIRPHACISTDMTECANAMWSSRAMIRRGPKQNGYDEIGFCLLT